MKPRVMFGAHIRELRTSMNLSQEKLADRAGLHRTYVGSVERGERNISFDNILLIARALNITPRELFKCFDKIKD